MTDLSLEVARGEVFGFLGPNGAGKTTTIRVLLDLIRPTSGRASVLGMDSRREATAIQAKTGYLPGELSLYSNLSGSQMLRYFASLRGNVEWDHVLELAERFDCDLAPRIADLSTGNKRKIGLIQAFMSKPELLMLDEPTSGLDPLIQREFYSLVDECQAAGQTVFVSSHVLPEVQRICDRVGFVREGVLVACEEVASLTGRAVRELEVVFSEPVPLEALGQIPEISNLARDGRNANQVRFTVTGPLDRVIKTLGSYRVSDLRSREPDLEDVFLTFYSGDETPREARS